MLNIPLSIYNFFLKHKQLTYFFYFLLLFLLLCIWIFVIDEHNETVDTIVLITSAILFIIFVILQIRNYFINRQRIRERNLNTNQTNLFSYFNRDNNIRNSDSIQEQDIERERLINLLPSFTFSQEHCIPNYSNRSFKNNKVHNFDISILTQIPSTTSSPLFNKRKDTKIKTIEEVSICSICLSNFCVGENLIVLPCDHFYHDICVRDWLKLKGNCPLCKQNVFDNLSNLNNYSTSSPSNAQDIENGVGAVELSDLEVLNANRSRSSLDLHVDSMNQESEDDESEEDLDEII